VGAKVGKGVVPEVGSVVVTVVGANVGNGVVPVVGSAVVTVVGANVGNAVGPSESSIWHSESQIPGQFSWTLLFPHAWLCLLALKPSTSAQVVSFRWYRKTTSVFRHGSGVPSRVGANVGNGVVREVGSAVVTVVGANVGNGVVPVVGSLVVMVVG